MSKKFAFTLSVIDWIRKLNYNYEAPIDFVDNFVSLLYRPGARVDISLRADEIALSSDSTIDDVVFEELAEKKVAALARFMPPSKDFSSFRVLSGNYSAEIDESRQAEVQQQGVYHHGTSIIFKRKNPDAKEKARLLKIYHNSDLEVSVDGEALPGITDGVAFDHDGFRGIIHYDPLSKGGVKFYSNGRYISGIPLMPGINILLYEHDFPPTITKSKVIINGKGKGRYEKLKGTLPLIVKGFLESASVSEMKRSRESSYQTILRQVFRNFGNGNRELSDLIMENIRFADNTGKINTSFSIGYVGENPSLLPETESRLYGEITGQKLEATVRDGKKGGKAHWNSVLAAYLALLLAGTITLMSFGNKEETEDRAAVSGQSETVDLGSISQMLPGSVNGVSSGGDYMTRDYLARILAGKMDNSGYVRFKENNHVFLLNGNILWGKRTPYYSLVSSVQVPLPQELEKTANSDATGKLRALNKHIKQTFNYGEISPGTGNKYVNMVEAMLSERRAICSNANSYAAMLLYQLGITNVRYAVGTLNGTGHAWLELYEGGIWKIIDFTPSKMDEGLLKKINEYGGISAGGTFSGQKNYLDSLDPVFENFLGSIANGQVVFLETGNSPMTETIGFFLLGASAIYLSAAGAYVGLSKVRKRKDRGEESLYDEGRGAAARLEDLVGMRIIPSSQLSIGKNCVYIPVAYLSIPALQAAMLISSSDTLPEQKKLQVYSRIANSAL